MPPQEQRNQLALELDRLADCYDAVADLLLAETVHQNVLGNHERAAAALAALDRQGRPPRVEFVRTPADRQELRPAAARPHRRRQLPAVMAGAGATTRGPKPSRGSTRGWRGSSVTPGGSASLRRLPVSPPLGPPVRGARAVARSRRCWRARRPAVTSRRSWRSGSARRSSPLVRRLRRPPSRCLPEPTARRPAVRRAWPRSGRSPAGRTPSSRRTARPRPATSPCRRTRPATGSTRPSSADARTR